MAGREPDPERLAVDLDRELTGFARFGRSDLVDADRLEEGDEGVEGGDLSVVLEQVEERPRQARVARELADAHAALLDDAEHELAQRGSPAAAVDGDGDVVRGGHLSTVEAERLSIKLTAGCVEAYNCKPTGQCESHSMDSGTVGPPE